MTEVTASIDVAVGPRYPDDARILEQAFTCDNCGRMNLMAHTLHPHNVFDGGGPRSDTEWLPRPGERGDFPDVPPHIADAAAEATYCLSVGAYRAVGSLARAVIEATAKEKQISASTLWARIDAMYEAGLIREHIREAAHEVRHFGNDMAHGDFIQATREDEAEEALALMTELLSEIFQSPARVARVREARLAKDTARSSNRSAL